MVLVSPCIQREQEVLNVDAMAVAQHRSRQHCLYHNCEARKI